MTESHPLGTTAVARTVTLLYTDIESSTPLVESIPEEYPHVIARSRELLRHVVTMHHGEEWDCSGGDDFFAWFVSASDAVRSAVAIQRAFHAERWPAGATVRVRVGIHTGEPTRKDDRFWGLDVHRTQRIAAAGSGGQTVLSAATRAQLEGDLFRDGVAIRDLGLHRLKGLRYPEALWDLIIPGLPASFAALRSVDSQPNNLPPSDTAFVGRTRHTQEIRRLLQDPGVRVVTLTGPGGTGKTRLALEVARTMVVEFGHGVFFVELAAVSDPALVVATIGQTLGIPEFPNKTPFETLAHQLAAREMLLVLDNFEQVIGAAPQIVDLLNSCPGLKVLATSRESLNVRLEREFPVTPLEVPSGTAHRAIESLAHVESVQLFIERARAYDGDFALTTANASAVSTICTRLDGLPLALELAASWLNLHTAQSLVARLPHSLDLLKGGPQDVATRQQTLKNAIGWSYDLLSAPQQALFERLAVFVGGSTIDAALTVAGESIKDADVELKQLVRKNLVTRTVFEGEPRLGMLETIRQFAIQQLAQRADGAVVREKHASYYLSLAEQAAPGLVGRAQRAPVTELVREQDNLRAALTWSFERQDCAIASRLITALLWFWIPRGYFEEARMWASKARKRFGGLGCTRELALIIEASGWLEALSGRYDTALPEFAEAFNTFQALSDPYDTARAHVTLGVACLVHGASQTDEQCIARGAALSDQALRLAAALQDKNLTALAMLCAGIKHQMTGNGPAGVAAAAAAYEQSLEAFSEVDNVYWPGQLLQNLALLRLEEGDWKRAAALASAAFAIGRENDYPMIRNMSLAVIAGVALVKGAPVLAAQLCGCVAASLAELGVTFEPPEHAAMERNVEILRTQLDPAAFTAAIEEGRRWRDAEINSALESLQYTPGKSSASSVLA